MRKKWTVIGMVFLSLMTVSCGKKEEVAIEKPATVSGVKTETIKLSSVEEEYVAVGTVRSKMTSALSSKTVGNILTVHVREGDRVRTGQLLVEMDDRDTSWHWGSAHASARRGAADHRSDDRRVCAAARGIGQRGSGKSHKAHGTAPMGDSRGRVHLLHVVSRLFLSHNLPILIGKLTYVCERGRVPKLMVIC